jgi:hypothetical protein|tara:strand:- start:25 stop:144 length:120 start_codon:yes stop_codon:yes gene_type:complete
MLANSSNLGNDKTKGKNSKSEDLFSKSKGVSLGHLFNFG